MSTEGFSLTIFHQCTERYPKVSRFFFSAKDSKKLKID